MSVFWILLIGAASWIVLIALIRIAIVPWLANGPNHDPVTGLMWRTVRLYCRLVHRVTYHGLHHLRDTIDPGPMIVVSNHTGSVDPLLIAAGCRFQIRWMMASEMMAPFLDFVWRRQEPIPVDRDGRDTGAARQAIRLIRAGEAVGIFPEGRIVQPPCQIRPFYPGVGLIVGRAAAPVLLVWISGTPNTNDLYRSLFTRSRAHVHYLELITFTNPRDAHAITEHLRHRLSEISGWPITDEPQPAPPPPQPGLLPPLAA